MQDQKFLVDGPHISSHQSSRRLYDNNNQLVSSTTYDILDSFNYRKTWQKFTPNFNRRKAAGELIPYTKFTQYEASNYIQTGGSGSCTYTSGGYANWSNGFGPWNSDPLSWESEVNDIVAPQVLEDPAKYIQSAASSIYSSGMDASTTLAELHKTVRMFKQLGAGLVIVALKNARLRKQLAKMSPREYAAKAASIWLEIRYGWRILLYDVQNLDDALNSFDAKRETFTARSGSTTNQVVHVYDNSYENGTRIVSDIVYYDVDVGVRGSVAAQIQPSRFSFNAAVTAWELVPFSFIVDWFISVGQWIASLSFLTISRKHTAASGYQLRCIRHHEYRVTIPPGSTLSSVDEDFDAVAVVKTVHRAPSKIAYLPSVNLKLDFKKVLDLLALLAQAMR